MTGYRDALAAELARDQALTADPHLYAPDGIPWCTFTGGSLRCVNGDDCRNPNHRIWREPHRGGDVGRGMDGSERVLPRRDLPAPCRARRC